MDKVAKKVLTTIWGGKKEKEKKEKKPSEKSERKERFRQKQTKQLVFSPFNCSSYCERESARAATIEQCVFLLRKLLELNIIVTSKKEIKKVSTTKPSNWINSLGC